MSDGCDEEGGCKVDHGLTSKEFLAMQQFIEDKCGIRIDKEKSYLIESKLSFLLAETGLSSFEELYLKISNEQDEDIIESIIDAITINETFWFRDKTPWYVLETILMPDYINELRSGKRNKVRIWSAACSYGQEPYSICMCIDNYLSRNRITDIDLSSFEIIATDISNMVLQMATAARYDNISMSRGMDEENKEKYFRNEGRVWTLCDRIKSAVSFRYFNLKKNDYSSLGRFDIIFLRNVLIYFGDELKEQIVEKMATMLHPNGLLFIGSAEILCDKNNRFRTENCENGVYYKLRE